MGNANTKESRPSDGSYRSQRPSLAPISDLNAGSSSQGAGLDQNERPNFSRTRSRVSRADLGGLLGITTSNSDGPRQSERRETRQEREARRLERERIARIKERERSLKEEHVDGGYLVTLGVYVGAEDFSKPTVRQLQIERKLAPFWRGLNDVSETWTEFQIIAAARGLPIPAADEPPPEDLIPKPLAPQSPAASSQNLNNLTVPIGGRSMSQASDHSASNPGSNLPSPTSAGPARSSSPFKPRAKALAAALSVGSRNASSTDITPRELNLPNDPFVNGQPLEVYLYKAATECPICFLYYPPYLNHTRCCGQPICSECFVQIKRPEPHYPEHHGDGDAEHGRNAEGGPDEENSQLISEPSCCPYCQQPEFGVTYEPPPFRRGLTYASGSGLGTTMSTAMSSQTSINSTLSPHSHSTPSAMASLIGRRRTQSLSANAPGVITTDRIRPDWATKLATQRAHQARRAAAATALHTAAFLVGNNNESRAFRVGRFSRRNTGGGPSESSPTQTGNEEGSGSGTPAGANPGPRGSSGRGFLSSTGRRSRMEDLEDMMFMEAIRLSLAAEEERKRKQEKEERKEAKKREKEERKAAKAAAKHGGNSSPYGGASAGNSGHSSASGSTLSLSGFGLGRRRGNSGASLRVEASVANAMASGRPSSPTATSSMPSDKGKGVDRGTAAQDSSSLKAPTTSGSADPVSEASIPSTTTPRPIPSPSYPAGPSHLRQMSTASSVSSSPPESYSNSPSHLDAHGSGASPAAGAGRPGNDAEGGLHRHNTADERDPSTSTEPMFNFRSLAEMVGVEMEGKNAGRRLSAIGRDSLSGSGEGGADESGSAEAGADESITDSVPPPIVIQHDDSSKSENEATEELVERTSPEAGHGAEHAEDSVATVTPETAAQNITLPELTAEATSSSDSEGINISPRSGLTVPLPPPQVLITPETPLPEDEIEGGEGSKQLGFETRTVERPGEITQ